MQDARHNCGAFELLDTNTFLLGKRKNSSGQPARKRARDMATMYSSSALHKKEKSPFSSLPFSLGGGNEKKRERRERALFLRSEEHTSELQSLTNLVCRLLLEKKKNKTPERSS